MSVTDIVVLGRRGHLHSGEVTTYWYRENTGGQEVPAYDAAANSSPTATQVQVRVSLSDSTHEAAGLEAAQNVANAVVTIIEAAAALPTWTLIALPNGKTTTAGQLLNDVKVTKFVITDQKDFGNNGVGGADRLTMTDKLFFGAYQGTGPESYTHAQWRGQGMTGILLHELGHLSQAGYDNGQDSQRKYNYERARHKTQDIGYYYSEYARDDERFQHQYAKSAAAALGIAFETYDSIAYYSDPYQGPEMVYRTRADENGWRI